MSKPITKEMWEKLEEELSGVFVHVEFAYKGHRVTVERARHTESKSVLQVYIDGYIKGEWVSLKDGVDGVSDKAPSILKDVWRKATKQKYSQKQKTALTKIWGKRKVKKEHPDLDDKYVFFLPDFSKSSVLCRQLKKLEGIELVDAHLMRTGEVL